MPEALRWIIGLTIFAGVCWFILGGVFRALNAHDASNDCPHGPFGEDR